MCRIEDAEGWAFFTHVTRRCRKPRRCIECQRTIGKGELYEYEAGKCDGYFQDYSTCRHCAGAREWLLAACSGFIFGQVLEELEEHWEEEEDLRSDVLRGLIDSMKAGWHDGQDPEPESAVVRASVPEMARA